MKLNLLLLTSTAASAAAFAPTFTCKSALGGVKLYNAEDSAFVPVEAPVEEEGSVDDGLVAAEKLGRGSAKVCG